MISLINKKFQDKKSFYYMAYKVFKSKLFSSIVLFISSIILIRALPKDDYGLYILTLVFFAFFELFLSGLDASLLRYINTSGKKVQHQLIVTIFCIKTIITLVIMIFLYFLYGFSIDFLNIMDDKLLIYEKLYTILFISFIFKYLLTFLQSLLNSYMLYDLIFKLTIFNTLGILAISISVYFLGLNVWQYLLLLTMFSFIYTILNFFSFVAQKKISCKELKRNLKIVIMKRIIKEKIASYSFPLLSAALFGFFKNYLPSYLFGVFVSLEALAVFGIFKRLMDFIHKGYASLIQSLYPKLFKLVETNSKGIDKLFWVGLLLRVFITLVFFIFYDQMLMVYNIDDSSLNCLVYVTIWVTFFIRYFVTYFTFLASSLDNTYNILNSSFVMFLSTIVISPLLYIYYNIEGLIFSTYLVVQLGSFVIVYQVAKLLKKELFYYIYILSSIAGLSILSFLNLS